MTDWMLWLGLAGGLVILEMFSGTFYLLMIGVGFAAGGLIALFDGSRAWQFLAAAIVGVVAIYALRHSKLGRFADSDAARDPNVNLDIGQTLVIELWSGVEGDARTARVMYRGAMWDVELAPGGVARAGTFAIREVRGSRLLVTNTDANNN